MKRKPPQYVRVTIREPFPVFYGHVSQKERRAGLAEGPHYSAGSQSFVPFTDANLRWKESSAESLALNGYTVTVEHVELISWTPSPQYRIVSARTFKPPQSAIEQAREAFQSATDAEDAFLMRNAMNVLACHYDAEGDKATARVLEQQAKELSDDSLTRLYRIVRGA